MANDKRKPNFKRIINPKKNENLFRFEDPKIVLRKLRDIKRKGLDSEIKAYEQRKIEDNRELSDYAVTKLDIEEETMALRIIRRFGSMKNIHAAFKAAGHPKSKATIYKWTYPKERGGTGGIIPGSATFALHKAAFVAGVYLSPEDLDTRSTIKKDIRRVGMRTPEGATVAFLNSIERKTLKNHKIEKRKRANVISRVIKRTKAIVTRKLTKAFSAKEERYKKRIKKLESRINQLEYKLKKDSGTLDEITHINSF